MSFVPGADLGDRVLVHMRLPLGIPPKVVRVSRHGDETRRRGSAGRGRGQVGKPWRKSMRNRSLVRNATQAQVLVGGASRRGCSERRGSASG
eukprot:CAMPEP_0182535836 /NCGR_PEP_ID=MMETSP1323-20130603/18775_1 /TAXON_ID=236787 /ORGANISM="Florenciella parvula, Strain RCC1693" /LENGTH=91 /DNA_ID=CAMNT_0024746015 /DNA_START=111 /DNA_END=383 /DNA_ORIENTATION=-